MNTLITVPYNCDSCYAVPRWFCSNAMDLLIVARELWPTGCDADDVWLHVTKLSTKRSVWKPPLQLIHLNVHELARKLTEVVPAGHDARPYGIRCVLVMIHVMLVYDCAQEHEIQSWFQGVVCCLRGNSAVLRCCFHLGFAVRWLQCLTLAVLPPREMAKKLCLLRLLPAGCGACICGNCWLLVIMLVMSAVIFTMTRKRRDRMLFSKRLLPVGCMNAVMFCKAASINSLSTSCGARKTHRVLEQLQVLQASLRTSIRNTTKANSLKRRLARPVDKTCVGT